MADIMNELAQFDAEVYEEKSIHLPSCAGQ